MILLPYPNERWKENGWDSALHKLDSIWYKELQRDFTERHSIAVWIILGEFHQSCQIHTTGPYGPEVCECRAEAKLLKIIHFIIECV